MHSKNNKGFTLIEVMVAMTILLVIIVVTFNLLFTTFKERNTSRERLQAIETASSVIDEIKSYRSSWSSSNGLKTWLVHDDGFTAGATAADFSKVITDSNSVSYTVKVSINSTSVTGLFDIFVTVQSPSVKQVGVETRLRGA